MKIIIVFLLISFFGNAQENNIWYFGVHAGLDFNNGTPDVLDDSQLNALEGSASISDENGALLFYTDGITVWNKNHNVMENGFGLLGGSSSIQSALIVPQPGNQSIYHIFTTATAGGKDGFRYSTVDMSANNGMGTIINKNILLQTPTTEAVNATRHENGQDVWVVAHNYGSNLFSSYLVTPNGVNESPVTSAAGFVVNGLGHCTLKVAPDGSKLAFAIQEMQNGTQLFDFNTSTGNVSNPIPLIGGNDYGLEFSPSGKILYTSNLKFLYQYDLESNDIGSSGIEIFSINPFEIGGDIATLQIAPDHKIYVARHSRYRLSIINNPDMVGLGCDFQDNGIALGVNGASTFGLPNTVLSTIFKIKVSSNSICTGQETTFSINTNQFETLLWEFGDGTTSNEPAPTHIFHTSNSYQVKLTIYNQGTNRIVEETIEVFPVPEPTQPSDLLLCEERDGFKATFNLAIQTPMVLGTQNRDDFDVTYHTSSQLAESGTENLAADFINTENPQTIYVRLENKATGCYAITSFKLIVQAKPLIDMPDNYTFCEGSEIEILAPEGFETYLWSTGETNRTITISQQGQYTLSVSQINQGMLCENSKTITVHESGSPIISQIKISEWTTNQNTITVMATGIGNYEYSIDGVYYQDVPVFNGLPSGIYTVYVKDKNNCGSVTEEVTILMYPKFFTPNGDGFNDKWSIGYSWKVPDMAVHIFDRYGKLIISLMGNSPGWDGTYNGSHLPATDYWFLIDRAEKKQYRGHFSLLR